MFDIGLLEFGYRQSKHSSMGVVGDIVEYAMLADQAGLTRFWLGEHHTPNPLLPYCSPEVLISILLSNTEKINIGVAGVLLNYYSPYTVALNYKLLSNLFTDRVDLGFANGASRIGAVRALLNKKVKNFPNNFHRNLKKICYMLNNEEELFSKEQLIIPPYGGKIPNTFLLSSSFRNLETATALNLNYSRSIFHSLDELIYEKERLSEFRELFLARNGRLPLITMATMISCSENEAKAKKNLEAFVRSQGGIKPANCIIGNGTDIMEKLEEYSEKFGIEEFTLLDCALQQKDKLKTIAILKNI